MQRIVYIEPFNGLIGRRTVDHYCQLNLYQFNRLEGITQAVSENPHIDFRWISNDLDVYNFIKSGEYSEYDGILITSPGKEVCKLISGKQLERTVFMVSDDADPGQNLNYTGPDHTLDARTIVDALLEEGAREIALVVNEIDLFPRMQERFQAFKKVLKERGLSLKEENIIRPEQAVAVLPHGPERNRSLQRSIPAEILKRDQVDVFVFLDGAPITGIYKDLIYKHNKRIPEEIKMVSMIGESLFPVASRSARRKISHLRHDYKAMGLKSVYCLVDILAGKRPRTGNKLLVPGRFIRGISISAAFELDRGSDEYFKHNVMDYIDHHYTSDITAKNICTAMELSYSYFLKKFKACFGTSLTETINRVRLDKAAHLLSHSSRSIVDIYVDVGYNNEVTFVRQFKKRFSKTPSEYRKEKSLT